MNEGRRPRRTSPCRVNWETSKSAPPVSRSERFIKPLIVGEDPKFGDLLGQRLGVALVIVDADAHERQQPARRFRR